jgi:Uma2 family endonuclease
MIQKQRAFPHTNPPLSPRETLPTMYDLPSEDPEEPGLPDEFHDLQPQLLSATLRLQNYAKERIFTGTDLNLYYDVHHPLWHKRPDWFLALGVPRLYDEKDLRASYVVWQEGVSPFVVVELLSPGTEKEDLGKFAESSSKPEASNEAASESGASMNGQPKVTPPSKWQVYEEILRIPYYVVFSRYDDRLYFFHLVGGHYQRQDLDAIHPRIWISELQLGLGLWDGEYDEIERRWLRWYDAEGNWVLTDAEFQQQQAEEQRRQAEEQRRQAEEQRSLADQERQRAQQEQERANAAEAQLKQVVMNLLQANLSISQITNITGLTEEQVRRMADGN